MKNFTLELIRKNIKNIYLKIKPNNVVQITCPKRTTDNFINLFLEEKKDWIQDKLTKRVLTNFESVDFKQGSTTKLFNKDYVINIIDSNKNKCEIDNKSITIFTNGKKNLKDIYIKGLKEYANNIYMDILTKSLNDFNEKEVKLTIRKTTTRWGSCNKRLRTINLSLYLIEKDIRFIEYVIYHEVAHLKEANHSQRYWNHLASRMPDYKERKKLS